MRYLGIDLGSKTVGLAMSDTTLTIASTYKTIFFKDEDYNSTINEIKDIIKENNIDIIDIKFNSSCSIYGEEQIYCFSALIMYESNNKE